MVEGEEMTWVLIDSSFLAHRALHSVGGLSFGGDPTGVIFGYLSQLRRICQDPRIESNKAIILCDSDTSYREKAYPPYKKTRKRKKTKAETATISIFMDQRHLLEETILPDIGFPVICQEGLESDDLIAQAAKQLSKGRGRKAVMVTADGDLYQCINKHIHWYDPLRRRYYDPVSFERKHGIAPEQWGEVKAIAGCPTDNVKGVQGIGTRLAINYLLGRMNSNTKRWQRVQQAKFALIPRNRRLVVLPHSRTKPIDLTKPKLEIDPFLKHCARYGLVSFLEDVRGWKAFFRGPHKFKPRRRKHVQ
jgi:DNA polymerase-1